jgi:hypothetical protein
MSEHQIFMLKMFKDGWGFKLFNKKPGSWSTYWSLRRRGYVESSLCKKTPAGLVAICHLTALGQKALDKALRQRERAS